MNLHMNATPETLTQGYEIPKKIMTPQRYDEPLYAPVLTTGLESLLRDMWTLHVYGILHRTQMRCPRKQVSVIAALYLSLLQAAISTC
jgi:hypothetical protein